MKSGGQNRITGELASDRKLALHLKLINSVRSAPEGTRVALGVIAGVLLPIAGIVLVVYRRALFHALVWLLGLGLFASLAIVCVVALLSVRRRRRQKQTEQLQFEYQVQSEAAIARTRELQAVESGKATPVSEIGPLIARNSEVVWFRSDAAMLIDEQPEYGELYVTSVRIVFVGEQDSRDIRLEHVNAVSSSADQLRIVGRAVASSGSFLLSDPELAEAHVRRSLQAFHREVDVGFEGDSRQISQEVKTAVWRRDGGKCTQCGASDYLEYDHIIPFSKGGATSIENLQLLCRRCNLKKRDRI